jgi:hypothetical protein
MKLAPTLAFTLSIATAFGLCWKNSSLVVQDSAEDDLTANVSFPAAKPVVAIGSVVSIANKRNPCLAADILLTLPREAIIL